MGTPVTPHACKPPETARYAARACANRTSPSFLHRGRERVGGDRETRVSTIRHTQPSHLTDYLRVNILLVSLQHVGGIGAG